MRNRAILYSLLLTIILNALAGLVTLAYANGSTIIETNLSNSLLLGGLGAVALLVRAVEIVTAFPLAYLVSLAISSDSRILWEKRVYLFTFSLLVALLAAAALADLLSDVLVVAFESNLLAGTSRILGFGFAVSVPFAVIQVARRWTLGKGGWTRPPFWTDRIPADRPLFRSATNAKGVKVLLGVLAISFPTG